MRLRCLVLLSLTTKMKPSLASLEASSTLFSSVMSPMKARPCFPSARREMPTSQRCMRCMHAVLQGWSTLQAGLGGLVGTRHVQASPALH